MKIIFVGLHNKVDKKPLDSSTKSGKLIDRIIRSFDNEQVLKSNLFDLFFVPQSEDVILKEQMLWMERVQYEHGDICVLLGNDVKYLFPNIAACEPIYVYHPASRRSLKSQDEYFVDVVTKIKNRLTH